METTSQNMQYLKTQELVKKKIIELRVQELKEAINKIRELKIEPYIMELYIIDDDEKEDFKHILIVKDNKGNKIFKKEISDIDYLLFATGTDYDLGIHLDYKHIITMTILEDLKQKKTIEDYKIREKYVNAINKNEKVEYQYSTAYFYIDLYVANKDIIEKLKEEINDANVSFDIDNNKITVNISVEYKRVYGLDTLIKIYVSKETAENLINKLSK